MAVLEALIEHEGSGRERFGEGVELSRERGGLLGAEHADAREAPDVSLGGADIVDKERPIQDDVIAGEEALDARVDGDASLVPDYFCHGSIPSRSGRPSARFMF